MSGFEGFPRGCFSFFEDLEVDNTKDFWEEHKGQWEADVRTPMRALIEVLDVEFPPLRLFRPHRDRRFSHDKSPYKLFTGATSDAQAVGGIGYSLRVDALGMTAGCGAMLMSRVELDRFRAAIDDGRTGREFQALATVLASRGVPVTPGVAEPLKRVPPAFSQDHVGSTFLRWKGAAAVAEFELSPWMHTAGAADAIRDSWHAAEPLMEWLRVHVGET